MPELLKATEEMAAEYARWFVNRRAYTRQSDRPHPETGRHYYFRPPAAGGKHREMTLADLQRHLAGEIRLGIYAINPSTQLVKWMAIDTDYQKSLDDLLKLQYELQQDGIQATLEQRRRGGHLWIFFEKPVLANNAHLYPTLGQAIVGGGEGFWFRRGHRAFPEAGRNWMKDNSATRFGDHSAFIAPRTGAPYDLEAQMVYLGNLRRVTDQQMKELMATIPIDPPAEMPRRVGFKPDRPQFEILDRIETRRRVGHNWVARCPSCAAADRDRCRDNLSISVELRNRGNTSAGRAAQKNRSGLGAPIPILTR